MPRVRSASRLRPARDELDRLPVARQHPAEKRADRPGAVDDDLHRAYSVATGSPRA